GAAEIADPKTAAITLDLQMLCGRAIVTQHEIAGGVGAHEDRLVVDRDGAPEIGTFHHHELTACGPPRAGERLAVHRRDGRAHASKLSWHSWICRSVSDRIACSSAWAPAEWPRCFWPSPMAPADSRNELPSKRCFRSCAVKAISSVF